jgi:eukaryotic-like serine/threonine-protein kinase
MGTVYRARDERLGREVAVKEIDGATVARANREAKAAARLNHPCIATLYELTVDERRTILVSELARGRPLHDLVAAGELTDRDVAEVGLEVAAALEHAHGRGVVHRDVKPANVLVDLDPSGARAKLVDFGIAALAGEARLTGTGELLGTLAYMAPEQAEGGEAGPEADTYSLALTLYECWSGSNPVAAATPAATARRIGASIPALTAVRPDLPQHLTEAVEGCLTPEPDERLTLEELGSALEQELPALDAETLLEPADRSVRSPAAPRRLAWLVAAIPLTLTPVLGARSLALAVMLALIAVALSGVRRLAAAAR